MKKSFLIFSVYLIVLKISRIDAKLELISPDNPDIDFTNPSDTSVVIAMDEENLNDVIIGYIIQDKGTNTPEVQFYSSIESQITGMKVRETTELKKYELVVTEKQDYESDHKTFSFDIFDNVDSLEKIVTLNIRNIDDEFPYLTSDNLQCRVKEADDSDTNCLYKITDDDREMDKITWLIDGKETHDLFSFEKIDVPGLGTNEMMLTLKLKKELVYEDAAIYIIILSILDTNPDHTSETRIVVSVDDVPNLPPVWSKSFQSQTFLEESPQNYEVIAKDGDIGINAEVRYSLIFGEDEDWSDNISIDFVSGKIMVNELDRDEKNRDVYNFKVEACEIVRIESNTSCINQDISFILIDINDNRPIFTIEPNENIVCKTISPKINNNDIDSMLTIDEPSTKNDENVICLELMETTANTIPAKISVNDIDSGENARYELKLTSSEESNVDHATAFSVAPLSGYQNTTVEMFIINYAKLDYEDDDWRSFSLTLTADEIATAIIVDGEEHKPITFHITLLNRNDEIPIFKACNDHIDTTGDVCVIEVEETFNNKDELLVEMLAEDRDIGGTLTYQIMGTYANQILRIDSEKGSIFVQDLNGRRPFDFETLPEVIVQVQVKDYLEADKETTNIALSQLTIKLKDVNDETPRISVETTEEWSSEGVPENCKDSDECDVGIQIIATDEDSTAKLEISIDWSASVAIKNGRKLSKEAFEDLIDCVHLFTESSSLRSTLIGRLKFDNTRDNNPDFEVFDTLDLRIVVTDTDQVLEPNYASINVQIYIQDINDNKPYFPDEPYSYRVTEETESDSLIGYITAKDNDVDANLSYSIEPINETPKDVVLVKINEKDGVLETADDKIDADIPIFKLYYKVTVHDGEFEASTNIEITVDDINDIDPKFEVEVITDIQIAEQSEEGVVVGTFVANDGDRDKENNEIKYSFSSNMESDLRNYFKIDAEKGTITVSYTDENQKLDRDEGNPTPPITIYIDARDPGNRVDSKSFKVILTDINNKAPVLSTRGPFSTSENKPNELITVLRASDADEDGSDNSKVSFEIVSIDGAGNQCNEEVKINFILTAPNEVEGTVQLETDDALQGFLGDYTVTLRMTDHGKEPLTSTDVIRVTINKYNFKPPVFISPQDGETYHLEKTQTINNPAQMLGGGTLRLEADDDQCNKFTPSFSVNDDNDLFTINSGYFAVKTPNYDVNRRYQATFTASTGSPSANEQNTDITATFIFVDYDISPVFSEENRVVETDKFHENEKDVLFEFPSAEYEVEIAEQLGLKIYYIIVEGNPTFSIPDNQKPVIRLDEEVDFEKTPILTVVVQASNRETGIVGGLEEAKMTITVNIQDVNDNKPKFEKETYYTTLKYDDKVDETLIVVKANDDDITDTVRYFLSKSGDYPSNYPSLKMDELTGALKLERDATSAATGYTVVKILARDCVESDGSLCEDKPANEVSTNVEIYVVSEDKHIVRFKFKNTLEDVLYRNEEIVNVLSNTFKNSKGTPYQANIKRTVLDDPDTSTRDDETETSSTTSCEVYFIDTDSHEPVDKALIESFASDVKTYDNLEKQFAEERLILLSFSQGTRDVDNTIEVLRAWLIGVAVVLGVLCVLLVVAFVLKTRSLSKRLNKLSVTKYASQESGLNRQVVPNTNRNALEGSNPVYSTDKELPEEIDRHSISSGDSDLIGVEDNPDFERKYQSNGVERY